jgi:hypothetical protein
MPQFLTTAKITDGPVPLCASKTCRQFTVAACKAKDGTENTTDINIGRSNVANEQPLIMPPSQERTFTAPANGRIDPHDWHFTVLSDDDGVVVIITA